MFTVSRNIRGVNECVVRCCHHAEAFVDGLFVSLRLGRKRFSAGFAWICRCERLSRSLP